jgi:CBS domain-containing protein
MEIADAVSTDYVEHDATTTVSKLRGAFEDRDVRVVVVTDDGEFAGVVAQRQLLSSHHQPDENLGNVLQHPPTVERTEDVRETARLMVENELRLLPVLDGGLFEGVVTAEALLGMVEGNLDALAVEDVYTRDLVAVRPEDGIGEVIHHLRENSITRVPVVAEDGTPEGLVSVYDVVDFVTRDADREQGGAPDGFDGHGGAGSHEGHRSRRGYGERAGEEHWLLDLPARDVMTTPARSTTLDEPLGDAVGRMLENGFSSLVVVNDGGLAAGIVTKTDALRALTWTEEDRIPVQVFNVSLLDTLTREEIAERVEAIDAKYARMDVQEVNVVFHEHEERQRGLPLVRTTIRLFTDEGRFIGTGEEYGARPAFNEAAGILEENVLEEKSRGMNTHTRKDSPKKNQEIERLLGWWLEAA